MVQRLHYRTTTPFSTDFRFFLVNFGRVNELCADGSMKAFDKRFVRNLDFLVRRSRARGVLSAFSSAPFND